MKHSAIYLAILAFLAVSCGDSADEPDATPVITIDSGPIERLDVVMNDTTICPDGWTTGPTASEQTTNNAIEVRAGCSPDLDEVVMLFSPLPSPGGTAPCFEATIQIKDGPQVICRANNQVRMAPEGSLTLDAAGSVTGQCSCTGDGGTAGTTFLLIVR